MPEIIAVVGGGISGLSAAYFALRKGFTVELFESTGQLGGLASSFDWGGLTFEKYYHFICGEDHELIELANKLGIAEQMRFRPTKTAIFYNGRYFPFSSSLNLLKFSPLSLLSRLRFGLNIINSKYSREWERLDRISAKEWLIQKIGKKAYAVIWHPLLKIKFGSFYDQISAAWVWHRIHRVASSRRSLFSKEKMGYFIGGTQTLINALEKNIKELGGRIRLNSEIVKIEQNKTSFNLLSDSQQFRNYDKIILAIPLPLAAKSVQGLDSVYSQKLSAIKFIGVVCGVFRLKKEVTDAFWLNINDPQIAVNGFIEYTNLNSLGGATSDKILYVPFYLPLDDRWFSLDDQSLKTELFKMIQVVNPTIRKDDLIGFNAFRSAYAQAICTTGFKDKRPLFKTPIENLYLLDATQLYPSDRVLSALIGQADKLIAESVVLNR